MEYFGSVLTCLEIPAPKCSEGAELRPVVLHSTLVCHHGELLREKTPVKVGTKQKNTPWKNGRILTDPVVRTKSETHQSNMQQHGGTKYLGLYKHDYIKPQHVPFTAQRWLLHMLMPAALFSWQETDPVQKEATAGEIMGQVHGRVG